MKYPEKIAVLFICIHNSARSQMAQAFLKKHGDDRFGVESAGIEPGNLNPLAVTVMQEIGIDISMNKPQSVADLILQGKTFDYVITVCDESSAERCPIFPALTKRLHWNFEDPSQFTGSLEEKLSKTRIVRDKIEQEIVRWLSNELNRQ